MDRAERACVLAEATLDATIGRDGDAELRQLRQRAHQCAERAEKAAVRPPNEDTDQEQRAADHHHVLRRAEAEVKRVGERFERVGEIFLGEPVTSVEWVDVTRSPDGHAANAPILPG